MSPWSTTCLQTRSTGRQVYLVVYNQDFCRRNKAQGYCRMVIRPKLEKLGLEF